MRVLFNILSIALLTAACISCNSVDYMNRKSFAELRESQGVNSFIPTKYDDKKVKEYGGIIVKNAETVGESASEENDNYYISFKREKRRLYAETLLFNSDNKEKSFIDQTFLDFGYDKKEKNVGFKLTLKY